MKLLVSETPTNVGRQKEVDYIKLIAIIAMVLIHVWEECTNIDLDVLPKGVLNNSLQFSAVFLGAPMFMTALGIGIPYTKNCTSEAFFKRGIRLFALAYILNFFRDALPYAIFAITYQRFNFGEFLYLLLTGDILQFAGLSFMLIALLIQLKIPVLIMNCIALVMQLIGSCLANYFPIDSNIRYILGLFYKTSGMCFPLLQWFVYPCFGFLFATYLRHITNKDAAYKALLATGAAVLTAYAASLYINGYNLQYIYSLAADVFYNQDFIKTFFVILAIIIEIPTIHFVLCRRKLVKLEMLAAFSGKHLNTLYIVQWLLVGWTSKILCFCFERKFEPAVSLIVGALYVVLSFVIVKAYLHIKKAA